jgi:DNA-binding NarL/FixJ family response regulator
VAPTALQVALEALGVPAFVLDAAGRVVTANRAGHALRDRERGALESAVERAIAGDGSAPLEATPIRSASHAPWWLAVQRAPRVSIEERARAAARRWRLTPRQAEVAVEVARGRSNRDVARALGCAESTVELHLTALLGKSGCQGRAELVARFWTEP